MSESEPIDLRAGATGSELVLRVVLPNSGQGTGSLRACFESLIAQSEPGWELGRHWEIVLVAVGAAVAFEPEFTGRAGVRIINAGVVPPEWTARTFACSTGARNLEPANAAWLLFTEADSLFTNGSTSRTIVEANRYGAAMLSCAPRWLFNGLGERAVMPLVLSELANAYPPAQVNDPERRLAYADGHFLLVRADVYEQLGGYQAVSVSPVPEVDLAFLAKRRKVAVRYRYAPDAVSAAPSPSFSAIWQQWTGTLAVLIDNTLMLAIWRALDIVLVLGLPLLALHYSWYPLARLGFLLLWARTLWRIYRRVRKSNAQAVDVALSLLGLPVFIAMLVVSRYRKH